MIDLSFILNLITIDVTVHEEITELFYRYIAPFYRISNKSVRSLEVFLRYEGSSDAIKLYEYKGPRDVAFQYWNHTEIDIAHNQSAYYKVKLTKLELSSMYFLSFLS